MRRAMFAVLLGMLIGGAARAQGPLSDPDKPKERPVATPRPPTGQALEAAGVETGLASQLSIGGKAPDFSIDGSNGRTVRLADLRGQWAAIVFADDRKTLGPLKAADAGLGKLGVHLYGMCRDGVAALRTYAEREGVRFVILSDLTGQVSQLYGMYNATGDAIQPGIVFIDPDGVVRFSALGPALHADDVLQLAKHVVIGG